jgi:hypothetical protein
MINIPTHLLANHAGLTLLEVVAALNAATTVFTYIYISIYGEYLVYIVIYTVYIEYIVSILPLWAQVQGGPDPVDRGNDERICKRHRPRNTLPPSGARCRCRHRGFQAPSPSPFPCGEQRSAKATREVESGDRNRT